jgi:hypothetical protein
MTAVGNPLAGLGVAAIAGNRLGVGGEPGAVAGPLAGT